MAHAASLLTEHGERGAPAPCFLPTTCAAPEQWPGLSNWIPTARRNALELFPRACYAEPFVAHSVLGQRIVVLSDPTAIAEVTGSAAAKFSLTNMHLRMLAPALGGGLIVAEGERWRRQRRAAIKIIAFARDQPIGTYTDDRIAALIAQWRAAPGPVAIQGDLTLLAIDLLAAELFHHCSRIGEGRVLDAIGHHRRMVERTDLLDVIGAPPWLATPRLRAAKRLMRGFDGEILEAIRASRHFTPPAGLTPTAQRDMVVNLMSGFESIAATATWLLGLIATHAPLYRWLSDPHVTAANRAERLDAAISETLRLYPPLPLIYRRARAEHDTGVGKIRRGAMVCMSPYVIHRNSGLWESAQQFDPLRAMPSPRSAAYMPFGTGARQCIGKHVGPRIVAQIVSAVLAEFHPQMDTPLPLPRAGLSLRPTTPLMVTMQRG